MTILWQNHIAGQWESAEPDESLPVINPATEAVLGHMPVTTDDDVTRAVNAASHAFKAWRNTQPLERSVLLRKVAGLLRSRVEEMADPIMRETGKPIAQARTEIEGSAKYLEWFAEEARRLNGEAIRQRGPGQIALVGYEPVGVVAALTAWNFPISLVCRKIGPALAAGCPVLVRPAVEGAGALHGLLQCFVDAGAPKGLVQLLLGHGDRISAALMKDERVRKVSFTGSVPVGKLLIQGSAATVKRLSLELGGHAPFIVFDDVDAAKIGAAAAKRKYANAGQICISPGRFYVHEKVAAEFTDAFVATAKEIRIGDPADARTEMGPLVSARRLAAMEALVENCGQGAVVLTGGGHPRALRKGYFMEPTVISVPDDSGPLMREEIFGPIAPISTFADEAEVLRRANDSELGLAGFVFTEKLGRAHRVADALECGIVAVNTMTIGMPEAPFGGMKQSGYGREGSWLGMMDYVQPKLTLIQHEIG